MTTYLAQSDSESNEESGSSIGLRKALGKTAPSRVNGSVLDARELVEEKKKR